MERVKYWIKSIDKDDKFKVVCLIVMMILSVWASFAYVDGWKREHERINSYNIYLYQGSERIARYAGEVINETEEEITIKTSDGDEYRVKLTDETTYVVKG